MILIGDLVFALFFLDGTQARVIRHVGLGLNLDVKSKCGFLHARNDPNYCRTLISDLVKVAVRTFIVLIKIFFCIVTLGKCAKRHSLNHGYPEYWNRVEENNEELKKHSLSGLYAAFAEGDQSVVKCRYW